MVRGFWWVVWGFWWVVRGFWWVVWGFWWVVRAKNGLRTAGATYTPAPGLWSPFSPHGLDGSGGFGGPDGLDTRDGRRSEEHTSELQSRGHLVCRLLLEKKKSKNIHND